MVNKQEESEGIDYQQLASEMKKAGIVTEDGLKESMQGYFDQLARSDKSVNSNEDDLGKHLRGECGNPECEIAKEAAGIYDTAYKRGLFHGTKMGGYAAKKGVFL